MLKTIAFAVLAAAALVLLAAAGAQADLIAAVDVTNANGDLDVALVNASTGARSTIPASLATSANELHPSLDDSGQRVVFERVDLDAGTRRIVLADLATGRESDLFSAFDPAQFTPSLSGDGKKVTTGNKFDPDGNGGFASAITSTDVSSFPSGPYPNHRRSLFGHPGSGRSLQPSPAGLIAGLQFDSGAAGQLVTVGFFASLVSESNTSLASPAPSADAVVFERAPASGTVFGPAKLAFRPSGNFEFEDSTLLPAIVNPTGLDESHPAFSKDGRYLAFVRHGSDDHDRLFVYDTQTQTLLNSSGVDLGHATTFRAAIRPTTGPALLRRQEGGVSLTVKATILISSLSRTILTFNLAGPTNIGILVQRIVGTTTLLGRKVPKLKLVGAVPLGSFKKGRGSVRWDGKVNGKPLKPGTYQVTPRAVAKNGVIRELGTPRTFRVR